MSGGVRGSDNPKQIHVKASDNRGEGWHGTFVGHQLKQNLFHPWKLLINHFETGRRRQYTAFKSKNGGFLAIYLFDGFDGAIVPGHTLTKGKHDEQKA